MAARAFAQQYLADLIPSVFSSLRDNGYFYDPIERGLYLLEKNNSNKQCICFVYMCETHLRMSDLYFIVILLYIKQLANISILSKFVVQK